MKSRPPRAQRCDLDSDHTKRKSITSQLRHQHPLLRFLSPTPTETLPGSSTAEETNTRAPVVPGAEQEPGLTAALGTRQHCQSRATTEECPEVQAIPTWGTPYIRFLYQFHQKKVIKLCLRYLNLLKRRLKLIN